MRLLRLLFDALQQDAPHHDTMLTQFLGQRTGIDAGDTGDMLLLQPVTQAALRVPVAVLRAVVADDDRLRMDLLALHERRDSIGRETAWRHAIVTHQRIGQDHQLSGIGGIRETLRITGHCGIEDDLSRHGTLITEGATLETCTVVED